MAIQKLPEFTEDMEIIRKLGDDPGIDDGLAPDAFKAKFDVAGIKLKSHLNTIIGMLNSLLNTSGGIVTGGNMLGPINMNGQTLSGLKEPAADDEAVPKSYVDALDAGDVGALPISGGTMTGGIDMGGQTLGGLRTPTQDGDAVSKWYAEYLAKMTLLWKNGSETSSFGKQSISINTTGYSSFVVVFKICASYNVYATALCVNGESSWLATATGSGGVTGAYVFFAWRKITISDGTAAFSEGMKNGKNTFTPEQDDAWAVPYKIFGIKGGID